MPAGGDNGSGNAKGRAADNVAPLRKTQPCPECGKPSSRADYPFCSQRCRDIDLNRWLSGSYAIPVSEEEIDGDPDDDGSRG